MRSTFVAALALAMLALPGAGQAQSGGDALLPPPDLGASGVPVPPDTTIISGPNPPSDVMAIPTPPRTCGPLAAMVRQNGVVLIPTANGDARRYVRDQGLCAEDQAASPAWVATDDDPRCFIGYTCSEADNDGGN